MKFGFRLVLHKDIKQEDRGVCLKFLRDMLVRFASPGSYKVGHFNRRSWFSRHAYGLGVTIDSEVRYVFRRLSSKRRVFGIVPIEMIERKDGEEFTPYKWWPATARFRSKVSYRNQDYETFAEVGEIKG